LHIILGKRPRLTNKVGNFLQDYMQGLSNIMSMPDKKIKRRMLVLWKEEFLKHTDGYLAVDTLLKNVIVAYYRNMTRKIR